MGYCCPLKVVLNRFFFTEERSKTLTLEYGNLSSLCDLAKDLSVDLCEKCKKNVQWPDS